MTTNQNDLLKHKILLCLIDDIYLIENRRICKKYLFWIIRIFTLNLILDLLNSNILLKPFQIVCNQFLHS